MLQASSTLKNKLQQVENWFKCRYIKLTETVVQNNNYHHKIRVKLESIHSDEFTRETAVMYWHKLYIVIFISLFCEE